MALDNGTFIDDRTPVTIVGIKQRNLGTTQDKLRSSGSTIEKYNTASSLIEAVTGDAAQPNGTSETTIQRVERLYRNGLINQQYYQSFKQQARQEGASSLDDIESALDEGGLSITLKYDQPDISVSTSGRFNEHNTIGGPVVRQKIGVGNVEVDIDGVCTTPEASMIDGLRNEGTVTLLSSRYSGLVQIASTSTNPMDSGGAMDLDGEFTHNFSMSLVEVE